MNIFTCVLYTADDSVCFCGLEDHAILIAAAAAAAAAAVFRRLWQRT